MIKGVLLAWKLYREGGVVNTIVELGGAGSLGVYRREEGKETINIMQTDASRCMT